MTNRVPLNMERLLRAESVQTERPHWMDGRDWSVNPPLAGMIQEVLWQMRPERCVESGTFLALGTAIIAKRLRDLEVRGATLDTVDFGKNDDDLTATDDDWRRLELARRNRLNKIMADFPEVAVRYHEGHTRDMLPRIIRMIGQWDFWFQDSGHLPGMIEEEWAIMRPAAAPFAVAVFDDINMAHPIRHLAPEGWMPFWSAKGGGQLWLQNTG